MQEARELGRDGERVREIDVVRLAAGLAGQSEAELGDAILHLLQDENPVTRRLAADVWRRRGAPPLQPYLRRLSELLTDADERVRGEAARALAVSGCDEPWLLEALTRAAEGAPSLWVSEDDLADEEQLARRRALEALAILTSARCG